MKIKTTGIEILKLVTNGHISKGTDFCDLMDIHFCNAQKDCEDCPYSTKSVNDEIEIEIPKSWVE